MIEPQSEGGIDLRQQGVVTPSRRRERQTGREDARTSAPAATDDPDDAPAARVRARG